MDSNCRKRIGDDTEFTYFRSNGLICWREYVCVDNKQCALRFIQRHGDYYKKCITNDSCSGIGYDCMLDDGIISRERTVSRYRTVDIARKRIGDDTEFTYFRSNELICWSKYVCVDNKQCSLHIIE